MVCPTWTASAHVSQVDSHLRRFGQIAQKRNRMCLNYKELLLWD